MFKPNLGVERGVILRPCWFCLNPHLGGIFSGPFWGGTKLPSPCLKIVRIIQETWNLTCKYRSICSFSTKTLLILLMLVFLCKKSACFGQNSLMSISSLVLELWQFLYIRDWPEIRKSGVPRLSLLNTWRLGRARNIKFGTNVSNKILLNAAKCQDYSLYSFWGIKGKPTGGYPGILKYSVTFY